MISETDTGFKAGGTRLHIPRASPNLSKLHTNIRLEALKSSSEEKKEDLHYSGLFTARSADIVELKQHILDVIERSEPYFKSSNSEQVCGLVFDIFSYVDTDL